MSAPTPQHRNACSVCARRKVKCDKCDPCSNCLRAQVQCLYDVPIVSRPRKRAADEDLLARLAAYEDLMRKHQVDFSRCANTFIPSGLEAKSESACQSPDSRTQSFTYPKTSINTTEVEKCLWSNLSHELKHPPIQSLRHKEDPCLYPTPPLQIIFTISEPPLHELHPEPKSIYRLWQIFVERVNPLTKIVHVPTLQQRILEASWDPGHISKPLAAILFAIYTLSVTALSAEDCRTTFGETRDELIIRYRVATARALIEVDFLTTRDLEVLQAFYLFLLADPESELTSTLTGALIRLGQKMGLHRKNADSTISFFEREMRVRLWWQLCGLDGRVRSMSTLGTQRSPPDLGGIRRPLNINDADLHPDMTEAPVEHGGLTEMMCVLMKFEVSNWLRSSPTAAKVFDSIIHGPVKGKMSMELEDKAIDEIEAVYNEKYLRTLDKRIPLHDLIHAMAKLAVARMRFRAHHPRGRAVNGADVYMTQQDSDALFESALTCIEMVDSGVHSSFCPHLFTHMTCKPQMEAYIYVISELRQRSSGERVAQAWKLVEALYREHPELVEDSENKFFSALADLTLEAWNVRTKESIVSGQGSPVAPAFVQFLWDQRQNRTTQDAIQAALADPQEFSDIGFGNGVDLDWEYWNEFLRL